MTREELKDWLVAHGCEMHVFEGINTTRPSIKFTHRGNRSYFFVELPLDETIVPNNLFRNACIKLGVKFPDCVSEKPTR